MLLFSMLKTPYCFKLPRGFPHDLALCKEELFAASASIVGSFVIFMHSFPLFCAERSISEFY